MDDPIVAVPVPAAQVVPALTETVSEDGVALGPIPIFNHDPLTISIKTLAAKEAATRISIPPAQAQEG